ncbi:MAG: RHS repeat-associated core domain-containing protein [Bacteroidota bacterium]
MKDNADYVQATWTSGAPTDTTKVAFFAWTTDAQATAYRLQLAPEQAGGSADFTQPWLETELTTWTSQPALEDWLDNPSMFYQALVGDPKRTDAAGYLVESVPMGTRMQWRVRAEGPGWASAWAQPKGFETEPAVVSRHYFVKDHLGSPRAVVDETGQVVEYRDHYPFGLEMPGRTYVSGVESRKNFTGHERDTETGLVYAGARYLDPVIGLWLAMDPMEEYPSPFTYVGNNPVSLVDPTGMMSSQPRYLSTVYVDENNKVIYDDGIDNGLVVHTTSEVVDEHTVGGMVNWTRVKMDKRSTTEVTDHALLSRWMNSVAQQLVDQGYIVKQDRTTGEFHISEPMGVAEMTALTLGPFAISRLFSGFGALASRMRIGHTVQFGRVPEQTYHAFRHVDKAGLDRTAVKKVILDVLARDKNGANLVVGKGKMFSAKVGNTPIEFRAFLLPNGIINVGRITLVP